MRGSGAACGLDFHLCGWRICMSVSYTHLDVIDPAMKAGDYPDVIMRAVGAESGMTETFIRDNNLTELTDVLDMTVPGEEVTVGEKILPGFTKNTIVNPYGDGKTYLMPMFYGPCGLFYNAGLFEEKGWEVPETWDEMWELGDKAQAEGIALFTYPTTGYFDAFFYALLHEAMGEENFTKALKYEEGIWDTPEAQQVFDIIAKLASYTEKTTPANANDNDFQKNQQTVSYTHLDVYKRQADDRVWSGACQSSGDPVYQSDQPEITLDIKMK